MRDKPKRPFYPGLWKLWGRSGETKPNKRLVTVDWNAGRGRVLDYQEGSRRWRVCGSTCGVDQVSVSETVGKMFHKENLMLE